MDNNIKFLKIKQENGEFTEYPLGTVVGVKGENEEEYQEDFVNITKKSIGLELVDNTPDNQKNVSHANNAEIANKAKELNHKLKFTGGIEEEFNGFEDKVITIDKNTITTALGYTPAGGENLLLNSNTIKTGDYTVTNWEMAEGEIINQTYTFSALVYIPAEVTRLRLFRNLNTGEFSSIAFTTGEKQKISITVVNTVNQYGKLVRPALVADAGTDDTSKIITVYWAKLEKGTVTDPVWTPAPQDVLLKGEVDGRNLFVMGTATTGVFINENGSLVNYTKLHNERSCEYIPTKPNEPFTVRMQVTYPANAKVWTYWICFVWFNSEKRFIKANEFGGKEDIGTEKFYDVSTTFTAPPDAVSLRVSARFYSDGKIKVERGVKPTPWTPAPEDVVVRSELGKTHVSKGRELPYTWEELQDMCNTGDFKDLEVGDYKTITVGSETVVMEIAGIDTFYNIGGQETHGQFSTTEYAPVPHHIDFISKDCLSTSYQWNLDNHNWGDGTGDPDDGTDQPFLTSYIKKSVLDEIVYDNLPEDVKKVIIPKINLLERRAKREPALTTSTGWHWYNMGKLWLPSEFEIFGTNIW